jgi:hypothetical protein
MPGYSNNELILLVHCLRQDDPNYVSALTNAVKSNPIIYGTAGKGGNAAGLHQIMADSINAHHFGGGDDPLDGQSLAHLFGSRASQYHRNSSREATNDFNQKAHASFQSGSRGARQRAENLQMMDMWYGDGHLGDKANPTILKFVKYAAKLMPLPGARKVLPGHQLVGPAGIDRDRHPYAIYTAAGVNKGWEVNEVTTAAYGVDEFRQEPMTATKELSRITRWLVGYFGGKIILDIHNVYFSQVFSSGRFGDTEMESRALFPHVTPGTSSGSWGIAGKIEIEFDGEPMIPSKLLLMTSWKWDPQGGRSAKKVNALNFAPALKALVGVEKQLTKEDYLDAIEKTAQTIDLERALWNKFPDFPPNFDITGGLDGYLKKLDATYFPQYGAYHGSASDAEIAAARDARDKALKRGRYAA